MTDYELYLAAVCAWREAEGQGDDGLRAVMFVLRNRFRDWRKTCPSLHYVITQHAQFSSMTIAGDSNTTRYPEPAEAERLFGMAKAILMTGTDADDPTKGAHYYENPRIATSQWFTTNIVQQSLFHPHTATIRDHEFYK